MTGLMILIGLSGNSELAADFGLVHGATIALFFAFSANARNLILNKNSTISASLLLRKRLLLMAPLGAVSYWLSVGLADVEPFLALILIGRRCIEWLFEIYLSDVESRGRHTAAIKFVIVQLLLFGIVLMWNLFQIPYQWVGIICWAVFPLCLITRFIWDNLESDTELYPVLRQISPHLGSSAITGITIYVFRLLLLLFAGRALAGDLFTAYAIGGVMSTVFANALGPSLAHQNGASNKVVLPLWLKMCLLFSLIAGIALFGAAEKEFYFMAGTKSFFFWSTTGLSMIGGPLMVLAHRIRVELLQLQGDKNVFGPDLIINLLMIVFLPFMFYILGVEVLKALFLFNSIIALVFYASVRENREECDRLFFKPAVQKAMKSVIALGLVLPLFFHLTGNIFISSASTYNSGGILSQLPIPVSIAACLFGVLFIGSYKRAHSAMNIIFFFFLFMLLATIISTKGNIREEQGKIIFMFQFLLPMFALALGQMFEEKNSRSLIFEKSAFLMLLIIVPCQIISTLVMKGAYLSQYLYFFSIYQHLQYVPVIFISLYLICLFGLWDHPGFSRPLIFLGSLMGFYALASLSMLAIFLLTFGLLCFAGCKWLKHRDRRALTFVVLVCFCQIFSFLYFHHNSSFSEKFGFIEQATTQTSSAEAPNITERIRYWTYYTNRIFSSPKTFLVGHANRPDRAEHPSAHNYYLDLVYNFGFLSLLPILGLLVLTFVKVYTFRDRIFSNTGLTGLTIVVLFLLFVDNSFKVGLRQPYPGIITFFLWGLLLNRLLGLKNIKDQNGT